MRLLIFGGTSETGIPLIREATAAGHTVVVYARTPSKLSDDITNHSAVSVIKGELDDSDALERAIQNIDVVVSTLGPPTKGGRSHPIDTPIARAYAQIITIMKAKNVSRIIAVGSASIKDPLDGFSFVWSILVRVIAMVAHSAYKEFVAIGDLLREGEGKDLEWTIARVPMLTNSDDEKYVAGYLGDGKTGSRLPRKAFAKFIIAELEKKEWIKKTPFITSP